MYNSLLQWHVKHGCKWRTNLFYSFVQYFRWYPIYSWWLIYIYNIIIIINYLFQAMPIKVRCTIVQTIAQILGARVHVRYITTLRTHIYVAKKAYICKYKHLHQWFHMVHFCMKVDDIKHVTIALLEHFSPWIKLYTSHPIHRMNIRVRKHFTGAASKM